MSDEFEGEPIRKNFGRWSVTPKCCCCVPRELDRRLFDREDHENTWDLSEYYEQTGIGPPGGYWRLTNNYQNYVPEEKGCIDEEGRLTGLPQRISSDSYKYDWLFKLEIGCPKEDGINIEWPGNVTTRIYSC